MGESDEIDPKDSIMKKQSGHPLPDKDGAKSSRLPEWVKNLFGAVVVGLVVLAGQIFVNPIVAERVRIQESITEKRYEACDKAIELLQRRLASATWTGDSVPEWYSPPEKTPPTQLEMNIAYTSLAVYCKSQVIADEFFTATGPGKTQPKGHCQVRFSGTQGTWR